MLRCNSAISASERRAAASAAARGWETCPALRVEAYQPWAPVAAGLGSLVAGGYLAEHRAFAAAFALVACFPLISLLMAWLVVQEPPARPNLEGLGVQGVVDGHGVIAGGFIATGAVSPPRIAPW